MTWSRIHSAPLRVLPKPRPASSSQVRQSPFGACWLGRPHQPQSCSIASSSRSSAGPPLRPPRRLITVSANLPQSSAARVYVLADNKLALNAGWDLEMLSLEIGELG